MSIVSAPIRITSIAPFKARVLSLASIAATVAIGGAACRSPKPGYFGVAPMPEPQVALASHRRSASADGELAPPAVVKAELSEWKIALNNARVSPGRVTIEVHNSGVAPHSLEIEGNDIEKSTLPVQPDSTITLSVDLKAGNYEIYCPLGAGLHKKMGMIGNLAVQAR